MNTFTQCMPPSQTQTAELLPFMSALGELPVVSSAFAHSHLQNTKSQSSRQSVLQLSPGGGVTKEGEEKAERRTHTEAERGDHSDQSAV